MEELFESINVNPSTLLNKTDQNILVIDQAGKIVFSNEAAEENINEKDIALVGDYLHDKLTLSDREEVDGWENSPVQQMSIYGKNNGGKENGLWKTTKERIPVDCTANPLRNEEGEVIGTIVTLRTLSDLSKLKEKLHYYKNHDKLTGLQNHFQFRDELENHLNTVGAKASGAVLLIDIDRFREVNNSFGFKAADDLLFSMAKLIRDDLADSDTLARFGGDEFVIFSPDKKGKDAEELATRIIRSVRNRGFKTNGTNIQTTVSVGCSLFPEQGNTVDELLAKADMALSQAKQSGRNQFKVYDQELDSRKDVRSRVGWVNEIDKAIKENNFVLYAQPILELGSDNISHYEVLIRMLEGGGELISPGRFLPVAEKFGLSRDIDRWVVSETLESLPDSARESFNHQLAINLSGQSLTDDELLNWLKRNQTLEGENFENILFEVTETAALSNIGSANNFISALKSRGSKFALDDFGMGFSSFNYLKQLSVDYLKIDGSFIQNLPRDSMNQDLVQSIVEVAHRLKKETIAEFVEDEETLQMVKKYGTDHAQGYHIGRPQPL
ncbi:MAG: EAL domain-containing protein, partial [Candidatus Bipolaricaulia bacterium]